MVFYLFTLNKILLLCFRVCNQKFETFLYVFFVCVPATCSSRKSRHERFTSSKNDDFFAKNFIRRRTFVIFVEKIIDTIF